MAGIKYREFWIYSDYSSDSVVLSPPVSRHGNTHVIEYRAYEELKAQLDVAVEGLYEILDRAGKKNEFYFLSKQALTKLEQMKGELNE